ncbi:hypothetical protein OG225_39925 [Nocardia sp. NBC_01377]|uniref:LppU/SCO3897 family protein n=1 Tax=Nocardia sp. NBC_01377 TaxID=2903595 RepID=UPI0032476AA3
MSTPPQYPRQIPADPAPGDVDHLSESDDYLPDDEHGESTLVAVLKLLGVFVVLGLAIFAARTYFATGDETVRVGSCGKLSGSTVEAEFAVAECADADANYVVAQRLDGVDAECASVDYASYYQTSGAEYTLCLRLNVGEGDCVDSALTGASTRVACTAAADFKVARIVRGTADRSACGSAATDEDTIVYPQPEPMTLCLAPPV